MTKKFKVLDLFSGAGGMSEGFLQAGFNVPCATDFSKEASETYINRHHQLGYEINFFNGDIRELTKEPEKLKQLLGNNSIDVISGGPPCQGFSHTGKRLADDVRNTLFLEYLKVVKMVQPKYFVIENVEGLLSYKFDRIAGIDGEVYEDISPQEVILYEAKKLGYMVKWQTLNAKHYGVPQHRPRVIFLGHQINIGEDLQIQDMVVPPQFPFKKDAYNTVEDAISDLNFIKNGEVKLNYNNKYGNKASYQLQLKKGLTPSASGLPIESKYLHNHQTSKHTLKTINRFKLLKPGECISELLHRLPDEVRIEFNTKKYRCRKLNKKDISPTVLTLPDDIIHYDPINPRILTVRELARLQTFDDSFEFKGKRTTGGNRRKTETPQYTQVGNAVPPIFARHIAEEIKFALTKTISKNLGETIEQ